MPFDLDAFLSGRMCDAYEYFGAHPADGGYVFRTWAPNARSVSVTGDFCAWDANAYPMRRLDGGIWECFVPDLRRYDAYKLAVTGADGVLRYKTDPYAFHCETRPANAAKLYPLSGYAWGDAAFRRAKKPPLDRPLNIYEVHLGSWQRGEGGAFLDYRTLADRLAAYVKEMGYNCVELMPITEYPLDDSWGYQCTGYFAPTSRHGTPHDFMYLVDTLHQSGVSVVLDWVPAHFCKDAHGLIDFDGTACYEYADPHRREHEGWGTRVFDYGRGEVRSFLLSSVCFWLKEYHLDGLRVDAVASMLYLDYGRSAGQWTPNCHGGHEHLEAIDFLRALNSAVRALAPDAMMIAEESTAWPLVTAPVEEGGLGFHFKWNMGWMNDACHYLKLDPWFRQFHHKDVTFSMMYAFSEHFILPISHDEVVYMKGSLRGKMPGDDWRALAQVRAFMAWMLAHPGKKLTFMGAELGQWHEWDFKGQLDWYLLDNENERREHACFAALNQFYLKTPALWEQESSWDGFEWLVADDNHNNVLVFLRRDRKGRELLVAVNFSPEPHENYRVGVTDRRRWREMLNTDAREFGGTGAYRNGLVSTQRIPSHGKEQSVALRIPPFAAVYLRGEGRLEAEREA